ADTVQDEHDDNGDDGDSDYGAVEAEAPPPAEDGCGNCIETDAIPEGMSVEIGGVEYVGTGDFP
ncbi:MAG: hypothetical protein HY553_11350, partial [Elusimicrobia bacterium]|nr:hypothetical protein [Elusimicrobiota bacterium]